MHFKTKVNTVSDDKKTSQIIKKIGMLVRKERSEKRFKISELPRKKSHKTSPLLKYSGLIPLEVMLLTTMMTSKYL